MVDENNPRLYFELAENFRSLSAEEEQQLGEQIWLGRLAEKELRDRTLDPIAKRDARRRVKLGRAAELTMYHANLTLVIWATRNLESANVDRMDLIQEGNIGLLRAVEKFDHRKGVRFWRYAIWWIRQSIQRAYPRLERSIQVPADVLERYAVIKRVEKELFESTGVAPELDEVATACGMSIEDVIRTTESVVGTSVVSLDNFIDSNLANEVVGDGAYEVDQISRAEALVEIDEFTPEEAAEKFERDVAIREILESLSRPQREVISARLGLENGSPMTLHEVATLFGISPARVRQIEQKTFMELRKTDAFARLQSYLDD